MKNIMEANHDTKAKIVNIGILIVVGFFALMSGLVISVMLLGDKEIDPQAKEEYESVQAKTQELIVDTERLEKLIADLPSEDRIQREAQAASNAAELIAIKQNLIIDEYAELDYTDVPKMAKVGIGEEPREMTAEEKDEAARKLRDERIDQIEREMVPLFMDTDRSKVRAWLDEVYVRNFDGKIHWVSFAGGITDNLSDANGVRPYPVVWVLIDENPNSQVAGKGIPGVIYHKALYDPEKKKMTFDMDYNKPNNQLDDADNKKDDNEKD